MSALQVGDLLRSNGRRALGREVLKIVDLDKDYAYCQVPGHDQVMSESLIRLGRSHIHVDGMERNIGWDRIARMATLPSMRGVA